MKNQLDEVRTNAMIIETTKQDDLDELKLKNKQELDSLNHIISNYEDFIQVFSAGFYK